MKRKRREKQKEDAEIFIRSGRTVRCARERASKRERGREGEGKLEPKEDE